MGRVRPKTGLPNRRLPVEPLLARMSEEQIRWIVGYRNVKKWQERGIPMASADHAAVKLGLHPVAIWGADWLRERDDDE